MQYPNAGDLIYVDFNPQAGHEQAGRRPALVLSPSSYTKITKLAIMCPVTSKKKGYPFEVELPRNRKITGVVLTDQIKCLDISARNAVITGRVPDEVLAEVREKLKTLLF